MFIKPALGKKGILGGFVYEAGTRTPLEGVEVTIGQDEGTAQAIEKMGSKHKTTTHGEVVVDTANKVYTTPCYMLDADIIQIYDGANNVVKEMMR